MDGAAERQRRIDELFEGEPAGFVAARDALAKELRDAGDREAAAEVKALRRPTVAAWAINRLARSEPDGFAELLEAGDALRTASLGRSGAKDLREAVARRRAIVSRLSEAAKRILPASSATEPNLSAIAQTLEAASVDEGAAEEVRRGRLSRELSPSAAFPGLGTEAARAQPPPTRAKAPPSGRGRAKAGPTAAEGRRREREAAKAEQRAAEAAEEERRARSAVERLEAQLARARGALKDRSAERRDADRAAKRARTAAG